MTDLDAMARGLSELARRVEEAAGPDRELDYAIFREVCEGLYWPEYVNFWESAGPSSRQPIKFTASLDAAMVLVPEDSWTEIKGSRKYLNIPSPVPNFWSAHVAKWNHENGAAGWGPTAALALCAAALKVRARLIEGR